jgi:hypothetical protein
MSGQTWGHGFTGAQPVEPASTYDNDWRGSVAADEADDYAELQHAIGIDPALGTVVGLEIAANLGVATLWALVRRTTPVDPTTASTVSSAPSTEVLRVEIDPDVCSAWQALKGLKRFDLVIGLTDEIDRMVVVDEIELDLV